MLDIIGAMFLCQVIVMTLLVVWLFVETYRVVARERKAWQGGGSSSHSLHKERCTYAFVSTFFALSYIGRFITNQYAYNCGNKTWPPFTAYMTEVVCYLFEGASMGVLMYFHFANFRQGGLFSSNNDEELAYASIMPEEFYRFDTDEVDKHSLTDLSTC